MLRTIIGELAPSAGELRLAVPARLLPQRLDVLDGTLTVVDNVARFATESPLNAIRGQPARMLFRASAQTSLWPRSRAGSTRQLTEALAVYQGALLIASYDVAFLRALRMTHWLQVDRTLTEIDPL